MTLNPFTKVADRFFGRGRYGVTVPSMDGALQPNSVLDQAELLSSQEDADNLVSSEGSLLYTVGDSVWRMNPDGKPGLVHRLPEVAAALAASLGGQLAVALLSGTIVLFSRGKTTQLRGAVDAGLKCITSISFAGEGTLLLANGSAERTQAEWQRDLLERNSSGSVWKLTIANDRLERLASGLGFPSGVLASGNSVVVSESWKHRLLSIPLGGGKAVPLVANLPGYPGRLVADARGSAWLCIYAPRSQLIEFVLREDRYRREMLRSIAPEHWIAPSYCSGNSFEEPLQGGGVKQMGILKPWAPTRSYGLVVKLDEHYQPVASFHSRSDGNRHGITSIAAYGRGMAFSSRGAGAVFAMDSYTEPSAGAAHAVVH